MQEQLSDASKPCSTNVTSALKRLYLQRYIHHIDGLPDLSALRFTRYNQYESMILPMCKYITLPGGKTITKGTLRGEVSDGMLCGLYELGLDERDFPYAAIKAAAILGNYHPLDKNKPSIPADIQAGDKVFGPVVAAKVVSVAAAGVNEYDCVLDLGGSEVSCHTDCHNIHEGDMLAYNTKSGTVCTLADLHAEQAEFPNCIPDGIFILHEDGIKPGDDIKPNTCKMPPCTATLRLRCSSCSRTHSQTRHGSNAFSFY